jgi:hypothetical protein
LSIFIPLECVFRRSGYEQFLVGGLGKKKSVLPRELTLQEPQSSTESRRKDSRSAVGTMVTTIGSRKDPFFKF